MHPLRLLWKLNGCARQTECPLGQRRKQMDAEQSNVPPLLPAAFILDICITDTVALDVRLGTRQALCAR